MTREEITKEAQEQVNYCTPLHPEDFIHGYIAGAEPREKRIAELKSVAEFQQSSNMKRHFEIQELEKKYKNLQTDYEVLSCSVGDFGELQDKLEEEQRKNNELSDNLTKAIELLKWALHSDPEHDNLVDFDTKWKEAEQFLKEIEK